MRKPWFRPRRFGIGAGFPYSWQGWLILAAFLGVVIAGTFLARQLEATWLRILASIATVVIASIIFIPIFAARTKGGWKWRWGRDR